MSSYDPQERSYYDKLFAVVDKEDSGVLPGQDALPFLVSSGLSQQLLGEVWALADPDNNGFLTRDGWYKAARLIGWLQKGNQSAVDESLLSKSGPYPTFSGQPPPPLAPSLTGSSLPPVTPADRTKFTRIFVGCGPQNGLVSGDKAQNVFVKSQLSYEKLGQIWNLADTQQRGSLDLTDFIIGMFLIQSCMANPSLVLPAVLPPGVYEQASGGRPSATAPMSPQRTGSSLRPQPTGPTSPINPQHTGGSPRPSATFATAVPASQRWDVTPDAKATSDQFFAQLDSQNRGIIEGDVAVPFMLQSQLDENTLATIWDLADIKHEGKLDRDQFAVAMFLINAKLGGKDVPSTLPTSLIPPSLRGTTGPQEVLSGPSSATKDLFDLFDDNPSSPLASSTLPQPPVAFLPQPPSERVVQTPARAPSVNAQSNNDLLWDEPAPTAVNDSSAEVGNKRNELANTNRSLDTTANTRQELEQSASDQQTELSDLESKLSAAKAKHEQELKAVADLRLRVGEQSAKLKQVQSEVISAESDVSAMRSEKDELGQALLRDKEEIRSLQKMMKEIDEEKATLKSVLEKMRKEARQQKGMVTIAKKQLSTAETSRDAIQKDIDAEASAAVSAAAVPLPATPQALSPVATGVSQRSNNPFDKFTRGSTTPAPVAAVLGASAVSAADAIVTGAEALFHSAKETIAPTNTESEAAPETQSREDDHSSSLATEPDQPVDEIEASDAAVETTGKDSDRVDPFVVEDDPFGMPAGQTNDGSQTEVENGFGDAFEQTSSERASIAALAPQAAVPPTDFDAAFADLEESGSAESTTTAHPAQAPQSAADRSTDDPDTSHDLEQSHAPVEAGKGQTERRNPDAAGPPNVEVEELVSSDEEEGPEDVEAPSRYQSVPPVLSMPVESVPARRSAPPPPNRSAAADFDPFGAPTSASPADTPAQKSPLAVAAPKSSTFDDDDFDFSDLPPAKVEHATAPDVTSSHANFDDEFAGFDDEFASSQPPSGSDNSTSMSKSYEMVAAEPRSLDEWGVPQQQSQPPSSMSFDDAFGGDFEPQMTNPSAGPPSSESVAPIAKSLAPPPLPQRQDSQPQGDDLEDVKKLCAMGFSRSLVIAALDANGYDFQKALNVLLTG